MYAIDKICEIKIQCAQACLDAPKEFYNTPANKLQKICNGVGSEAMPHHVREILSKIFSSIEATAAIHDFEYEHSDGTDAGQEAADNRFLTNGLKEIYSKHGFFSWRRYRARFRLLAAFDALRAFGSSAWKDAFVKNQKKDIK